MDVQKCMEIGEYAVAGLFEEEDRGLFYRKALGLRRYYENCKLIPYRNTPLYPSGAFEENKGIGPYYLNGFRVYALDFEEKHPEIMKEYNEVFGKFRTFVSDEQSIGGNMYTHSMPNYPRFLKEGLLSYIPRIEKIKDKDIREGLLHLVEGIKTYVERCVRYLISVNADEKMIETAKKVPLYPAENIYEAIYSWNFIMYLDTCDNLGCLSKGLAPYFKGENIVPLLENLYDNLNVNNGYSMSLETSCPELARQCLIASRGKRRPMIEFFVKEDMPEYLWHEAFESVRTGNGQPAFYNSDVLFDGLRKRFPAISEEDIKSFCGGGCTESMISGYSCVGSMDAGIHMPLILERLIDSRLAGMKSFDEFYNGFLSELKKVLDSTVDDINNSRILREETTPIPMRTLLIDDCIDNGKDYNAGGARYNWSIINFAGMINIIDSLLTIKNLVFDKKKYTGAEVVQKLKNNDAAFLDEARNNVYSFGRDQATVNEFAHEISEKIFAMTNDKKLYHGMGFLSASIMFNTQADAGSMCGASADGRPAKSPLCDSLAAILGKDSLGPTAMLNSVTSLDLKGALGVPVVNFNVRKEFDDNTLKALILGYMKNGGIQMQLSCASKEELIDAYEHPELHKNLVVRVGGYSEYFVRLPNDLKMMIINRTIQNNI